MNKTEEEFRRALVDEALTWVGTPYRNTGRLKGVAVNCAQLLYGVARNSGAIPDTAPEPKWFTSQFATHQKQERLIEYIQGYGGIEVQEHDAKAGDIVLYKTGEAHGHAAIVIDWPQIVHALPRIGCQRGALDEGALGKYSRRYFTLWKGVD